MINGICDKDSCVCVHIYIYIYVMTQIEIGNDFKLCRHRLEF